MITRLGRIGWAGRGEPVRFAARARRAAVLALVAAVLAVGLVVNELLSWTLAARADLQAAEIAIRNRASGGGPEVSGGERNALGNRVLRGASTADVQAGIQSAVKAVADAHRVRIETIQLVTPQRVGDLSRLTVRVTGSIEEAMLGAFLAGLAKTAPVIGVQSIEARPQPPRAALVGGDREPPQLALSMVLAAFAATPDAAAGRDQRAAR